MTETKESQRIFGDSGCCCSASDMFIRRYESAKEEQKRLEEYRDQLKNELAGVEERIQELKSK